MKAPESMLQERIGELRTVKVLGKAYDLHQEVAIPRDADIEDLLYDNVERIAFWGRLVAKCRAETRKAEDALEEAKAFLFMQYYRAYEDSERAEMKQHLLDEKEMLEDPFKRRQKAADRVARGATAARWNRNFSDTLIQSLVNSHEKTVQLRADLRRARNQQDLSITMKDVLEHRSRCISHLAAIHRDNTRS